MKGILFALLATISYSSTPTFTQLGYKGGIATDTLLFSRHLVSFIFLLPLILRKGFFSSVGKKQIPGIILLCVLSVIGNVMFNYAYHYLPNIVGVSVSLIYIVMVVVIELIMGREKYTPMRGLIIALTVMSMLIIAIPGSRSGIDMKAFVIGILASLNYSIQLIFMNSKVMKEVSSEVILLTGIVPIMIVSSFWCITRGEPLLPSNGTQWFAILCLGTIGVIIARGLFYKAVRMIGASTASMIDALEPLSSAVLGFAFLRQIPTISTGIGSVLLMFSVFLLLRTKKAEELKENTEESKDKA